MKRQGIDYKLKEWHVLQILQGDLKIEMGSAEHWLTHLPTEREILQVDEYTVQVLSLDSLREFYRQAMNDRSAQENQRAKFEALKEKYELLNFITQKDNLI